MMKVLSQCIEGKESYEEFYKLRDNKTKESAAQRLVEILTTYINDKHIDARIEGVEPAQVQDWLKKEISNDRQTIVALGQYDVADVRDLDTLVSISLEDRISQDIVYELMQSMENSLSREMPLDRDKNYAELKKHIEENIKNIVTDKQFLEYIKKHHASSERIIRNILILQEKEKGKQFYVNKITQAMISASESASDYASLRDNMDNAIIHVMDKMDMSVEEEKTTVNLKRDNRHMSNGHEIRSDEEFNPKRVFKSSEKADDDMKE